MNEPSTISIIEGDDLTRQILARWIDQAPGFRCRNTYAEIAPARHGLPDAPPDLVLVDAQLPDALSLIKELKPRMSRTGFILLRVYENVEQAFAALEAGAAGCLSKSTKPADLIAALEAARRNVLPLGIAVARKVLQSFSERPAAPCAVMELGAHERIVLEFLARGYCGGEIAAALGVSAPTVGAHLRGVCLKLQARSRLAVAPPAAGLPPGEAGDKSQRTAAGFLSIKELAGSRTVTTAG